MKIDERIEACPTCGHACAVISRSCMWCAKSFKAKNRRQRFCTARCRSKNHQAKRLREDE